MKFCPKCGKKGIKGTFCSSCSKEAGTYGAGTFKDINVTLCSKCKALFFRGDWRKSKNITESIKKITKEAVSQSASMEIVPLIEKGFIINPGQKKDIEIEINHEYVIPGTVEGTLCNGCSKIGTKYFEGILQLRNYNDDITIFVKKQLELLAKKKTHVTKVLEVDTNSSDLYFTSQKSLRDLGNKLQKRFGGTLKISNRLFSTDRLTSKFVYRVNALYEPLGYVPGDIIAFDSKIIKVMSLGKLAGGINIVNNRKEKFHPPAKFEKLKKQEVVVASIYPEVKVIDPTTYQTIKLENKPMVVINQKIKIVKHNDRVYALDV